MAGTWRRTVSGYHPPQAAAAIAAQAARDGVAVDPLPGDGKIALFNLGLREPVT